MNKPTLIVSFLISAVFVFSFLFYSGDSENRIDLSIENQNRLAAVDPAGNKFNRKHHQLLQEVKSLKHEVEAIKLTLKQIMSHFDPTMHSSGMTSELNELPNLSQMDLEEMKLVEENIKKATDQQYNEQMAMIEDEFIKEPVNPEWSDEKSQILITALNSLPEEKYEGVELKETDCRSSMCRIEIEFADELAQNRFEMQLPMLVGEDFPRLSVMHENQEGLIRGIYLLKGDDA